MLFGTTPFQDSATWGILFNRISSAEYTIPDDPTVSDAAKAFVRRLLQADPSKRPSALEALEDPWLVEHRFAAMKLRPDEEKVVPGDEIVPGSQSEGGHSLVSLAERDHAPGDDGFRTVFMESGVRVYFDEEAGALRISDPKSSQAPNTTESFNHAEAERTLQPRLKAGYVDFTEEKKDIEI